MEKIGKYELIRKLATGGSAEVFLAKTEWAHGVEKQVVVKRILPHLVEDQSFVEMFLSEAKLSAHLSHPNIAQTFEFGEMDGVCYLAMEYVDGANLRKLLVHHEEEHQPMPYRVCAKLVSYACEALACAHDLTDPATGAPLGLVHRDVSPENILIARTGAVKVVDFGVAKSLTQAHRTRTGTIKGKLEYMSPEQLRAQPLDRRTDVYALGVVLYEMLAGVKPNGGKSDVSLIHAMLFDAPVLVQERRGDVPQELASIVARAMAREPEGRYPDCRAMQQDLERYIMKSGDEPVGSLEISRLVADVLASETVQPEASRPGGRTTFERRSSQDRPASAHPPGAAAEEPQWPSSDGSNASDGSTAQTVIDLNPQALLEQYEKLHRDSGPKAAASRASGPKASTSGGSGPKAAASRSSGPKAAASRSSGPKAAANQASGPKSASVTPASSSRNATTAVMAVKVPAPSEEEARPRRGSSGPAPAVRRASPLSRRELAILGAAGGALALAVVALVLFLGRPRPVRVEVSPWDASVLVDGRAVASDSVIKLAPGEHRVEATAAGFRRLQQNFSVRRDTDYVRFVMEAQEVARAAPTPEPAPPPPAPAPPPPRERRPASPPRALGSLACATQPPGATVYIDGKSIDRTTPIPMINPYPLAVGKHQVAFELEKKRIELQINVKPGELTIVKDIKF